ncbi:AGE family epimerase/isomerase [Desulfoluna spongiiphila]|uniref:AGE family epimerase/isomerase n=1 Tax=Desulfoluna spongiiphila TaxID=419481 RepID=UPI00125F65A1|nr:AGE family epimerase/isomerase [Desulfoluna spongiiphila]
MNDQESIRGALGNLVSWLETWRDNHGAYNGFVVHRTEAKRMDRVHDTAWSQAAMIRGYGNLYRKSLEPRWGKAMSDAADLFASRYEPETGRILHTGHEDERFQSLVSCALGVCALLSVADLVDDNKRKNYLHIASDHARRYWFDVLWVETEGAFKFTEIDYYSLHEDRFVVNFNTMAAEALLSIYDATGDREFYDKAIRVGQWLMERWNHTQTFNDELLKGCSTTADSFGADRMPPGGFSYQFKKAHRDPDNYVTLYAGLSLRGFYALYCATHDECFAEMIRAQSAYILAMRDSHTRLFYHTAKQGRIEKNPQFVAGAGMTLVGLHVAMPLIGELAVPEDTIESIMGRVYANGSYPGFVGKNDTGLFRRERGGVVWEDVAASVNWNAQWFEYLTRLVEEPEKIDVRTCDKTVSLASMRFVYRDTPKRVQILSWWPVRSWGLFLYTKKRSTAWVSIYPKQIYRRIRPLLGGIIK